MTPGTKVIYTHSGGMDYGHPLIGYYVASVDGYPVSAVGVAPDTAIADCEIIHTSHIHPHSDALWAAWCQWLEDDRMVREQHKKLMAAEVPTIGLF